MAKWTIYDKSGNPRHWYHDEVDADGNIVRQDTLELHDEWMGECFLTVSIKNAEPIDFAVGDYIDYRGERYTIEYDPTVLKKARSGSYGEGFTYDNIKFVSEAQAKIVRCDFTDIVLYDNGQHYTSLPTFPFYCETVDDLLDRIQANLNELYDDEFIIIGMNQDKNLQRAREKGNESREQAEYNKWIGSGSPDYGNKGVALTVDNINCWDALAKVHSDFGLNFIVRGYTIIVGTAGMFTQHKFTYGKGNGLYEVEKIGDSEQQIVTRLRAYGSETNLPLNYYPNLYKKPILVGKRNREKSEVTGREWYYGISTEILWNNVKGAFNITTENNSYLCDIEYNNVTAKAWVVTRTNGVDSGAQYLYLSLITDNDQDLAFYNALGDDTAKTINILSNVKKEKWPASMMETTGHYTAALVINRLMLPGFPEKSLDEWVQDKIDASQGAEKEKWQDIYDTYAFSTDTDRPYIDSPNTELYGIRPGSIYFDGNNDNEDIHPTITGTGYDHIVSATQVDDQGVFNEKDPDPITIVIPGMGGFKLDEAWNENESSIDITDGMCGGRSFQIVDRPKLVEGNWECKCKRAKDDSLHLWFPYCDFQINANNREDHFVLTGIDLPEEYVTLASERLFDAAIEALRKNDAPRFTFQPRIDEIWMQRQDDLAKASQEDPNVDDIPSIHDTLKAGDIFRFADGDIMGVDENDQPIVNSIIIDVLTIKENGNNGIPTYEVTLRDEKQVSTIQKIQNKIDSLANGGNGYGGGGGGSSMTPAQIDSLVPSAGENYFISKQKDDSANGIITFLKGIKIGLQRLFGWDADGNITANNIAANSFNVEKFTAHQSMMNEIYSDNYNWDNGMNGTGFILTKFGPNNHAFLALDDLVVRGKMTVNTLEIREETYTGGNQHWSPAGSIIFRVDYLDENGQPLGYQTVAAPWLLNGQPFLTVENQQLSSIAYASRKKVRELIGSQISAVKTFRCYIIADNGSTTTRNFWCIGDQARCQTYNIVSRDKRDGEGDVGAIQSMDPLAGVPGSEGYDPEHPEGKTMENVYYWRLVVGVGTAKLEDGKTYNYIDLSNEESEERGIVTKRGFAEGSDIPATGDTLVCFGNDANTDRMGVVSIETYNSANELHTDETPAIKMYAGVNTFSMNGKRTAIISPGKVEFTASMFRLVTHDGTVTPVANERGNWTQNTAYFYYDVVQHNGSSWLCVVSPDFFWIKGTLLPWETGFDWTTFETLPFSQGILNEGESGMTGSKGHEVSDRTKPLVLCQTFTTSEPSSSNPNWRVYASKGVNGTRGDFKSRVFCRTNDTPTTPVGTPSQGEPPYNTYDYPIPPASGPNGKYVWSDGVPSGEHQIWSTTCTFFGAGGNSGWSTPQPESDTASYDTEFAYMQNNDAKPSSPNDNNRHKDEYPYGYEGQVWFDPDKDKYSAQGVLRDFTEVYWQAYREKVNGEFGDWTIIRIKGEKGDAGEIDEQTMREIVERAASLVDAGYTLIIDPSVLIYNQDSTTAATFGTANSGQKAKIKLYKGDEEASFAISSAIAYGVSSDGTATSMGSSHAGFNNGTHTVWLSDVSHSQSVTTGYYTYTYDHGYILVLITVDPNTADEKEYSMQIAWYLNRLGNRETTILGDVEKTYMTRTEYSLDDQYDNLLLHTQNPENYTGDGTNGTWNAENSTSCTLIQNVSDTPVNGYTTAFRVTRSNNGYVWKQSHTFWRNHVTYKFSAYVRSTSLSSTLRISVKQGSSERFYQSIVVDQNWNYVQIPITMTDYVETYDSNKVLTSSAYFQMGCSLGTVEYIVPTIVDTTSSSVLRSDYEGKIETSAKGIRTEFTEDLESMDNNMIDGSDGEGWRNYNGDAQVSYDSSIQKINGSDIYSTAIYLKNGTTYTFSAYCPSKPSVSADFCGDNPETIASDALSSITVNVSNTTVPDDTYQGCGRYYGSFTADADGYYKINVYGYSPAYIYRPQLEVGATPTKWVKSISKNYSSMFEQTARGLRSEVSSTFGNYYTKSQVDQTASSITSIVTEVQGDVADLQSDVSGYDTRFSKIEQTASNISLGVYGGSISLYDRSTNISVSSSPSGDQTYTNIYNAAYDNTNVNKMPDGDYYVRLSAEIQINSNATKGAVFLQFNFKMTDGTYEQKTVNTSYSLGVGSWRTISSRPLFTKKIASFSDDTSVQKIGCRQTTDYTLYVRNVKVEVITADNRNLNQTGIDISQGRIDMLADNFTIKNSSNEQTLGLDSDGNFKISGTINAKLFYAEVQTVTGNTTITNIKNAKYTYFEEHPATTHTVTLPAPVEGVELRFFSPITGSGGNVMHIAYSGGIMVTRTVGTQTLMVSVTDLALKPFRLGTVKAINNKWWVIDDGFQTPSS